MPCDILPEQIHRKALTGSSRGYHLPQRVGVRCEPNDDGPRTRPRASGLKEALGFLTALGRDSTRFRRSALVKAQRGDALKHQEGWHRGKTFSVPLGAGFFLSMPNKGVT